MVAYDTGCIRGMGLIYRDVSWGCPTGSGRKNRFVGVCHGDARHWLDRGDGIESWDM